MSNALTRSPLGNHKSLRLTKWRRATKYRWVMFADGKPNGCKHERLQCSCVLSHYCDVASEKTNFTPCLRTCLHVCVLLKALWCGWQYVEEHWQLTALFIRRPTADSDLTLSLRCFQNNINNAHNKVICFSSLLMFWIFWVEYAGLLVLASI